MTTVLMYGRRSSPAKGRSASPNGLSPSPLIGEDWGEGE